MPKIYFITGSSGIGKTTLAPVLRSVLSDDYIIHDFDEKGIPIRAGGEWRQKTSCMWLKTAIQNAKKGKPTVIIGLSHPDEVMRCPQQSNYEIVFGLLEADDANIEKRLYSHRFSSEWRIKELKKYTGDTPEQFIKKNKDYRKKLRKLADQHNAFIIDTTNNTPEQVAIKIKDLIDKQL